MILINSFLKKKFLKNGYACFPDILYPYVANVILNIMFGERFDRSQYHKLIYFCESSMMFQKSLDTSGGAIFQFWFLKYFGNIFGYTNAIKATYQMINFIEVFIHFLYIFNLFYFYILNNC